MLLHSFVCISFCAGEVVAWRKRGLRYCLLTCGDYYFGTWLTSNYYEEKHWKSEWGYVFLMPLITTVFAVCFLILGYYSTVHLMGIQAQVCMLAKYSFVAREKDLTVASGIFLHVDRVKLATRLDG